MENNSYLAISSHGVEWSNFLETICRSMATQVANAEYKSWFNKTIETYGVKYIDFRTCQIFFESEDLSIFKLKFG